MFGRVTKFFHNRGFGFILGEDGNTYFVPEHNVVRFKAGKSITREVN